MDTVISDIGVDAVKTGMLVDAEVIETVSQKLQSYDITKVIVDPLMNAKSGAALMSRSAYTTFKKKLSLWHF